MVTNRTDPPAPRLLRKSEVCARTGLSFTSIWRLMKAGDFPRSVPLTEKLVAWPENEVSAWITRRVQRRAPAPAASEARA